MRRRARRRVEQGFQPSQLKSWPATVKTVAPYRLMRPRDCAAIQTFKKSSVLMPLCSFVLSRINHSKIAVIYNFSYKTRQNSLYLCSDDEISYLHISFSPLPRPQPDASRGCRHRSTRENAHPRLELEAVWSEGFNSRSQLIGLQRLKPLLHIA